MKASTIPEFLILDSENEARELSFLTQYFPVEDGEVFRNILECIAYEQMAEFELEVHKLDVQTMLVEGGHGLFAESMANLIHRLGLRIFRQLRDMGVYYKGYLPYCYCQDIEGDLVLRALEHRDLSLTGKEENEEEKDDGE
jgi:hypothetical protein